MKRLGDHARPFISGTQPANEPDARKNGEIEVENAVMRKPSAIEERSQACCSVAAMMSEIDVMSAPEIHESRNGNEEVIHTLAAFFDLVEHRGIVFEVFEDVHHDDDGVFNPIRKVSSFFHRL